MTLAKLAGLSLGLEDGLAHVLSVRDGDPCGLGREQQPSLGLKHFSIFRSSGMSTQGGWLYGSEAVPPPPSPSEASSPFLLLPGVSALGMRSWTEARVFSVARSVSVALQELFIDCFHFIVSDFLCLFPFVSCRDVSAALLCSSSGPLFLVL